MITHIPQIFSSLGSRLLILVLLAVLPALGLILDFGREPAKQLLGALAPCPAVRQPDTGISSALLKRLMDHNRNYSNQDMSQSDDL
jgi:hypothetical protein